MTYKQMYLISAQREEKRKEKLVKKICMGLSVLMLIGIMTAMFGVAGADGNTMVAVILITAGLVVASVSGAFLLKIMNPYDDEDDYDYIDEA